MKPKAEYIDKNALIADMSGRFRNMVDRPAPPDADEYAKGVRAGFNLGINWVKACEPVEYPERKPGTWKWDDVCDEYFCSECGRSTHDRHDEYTETEFGKCFAIVLPYYCGFCGADMRGDGDG